MVHRPAYSPYKPEDVSLYRCPGCNWAGVGDKAIQKLFVKICPRCRAVVKKVD